MEIKPNQLVIMLTPFVENETYGTVKMVMKDRVLINIKGTIMFPKYSEILCIIIDDNEMFEFYSTVEDIVGSSIFIAYSPKDELSLIEKRKFNRTDCEIGFVGNLVRYNDKSFLNTGKQFTGTIKNISAGGVLTQTGINLPIGMEISFKLKLNYFMDCTAIVRRSSESDNNNYLSGCEFIDMNLSDIKEISLFVFKQQLKNIQREMQKNKMSKFKQ